MWGVCLNMCICVCYVYMCMYEMCGMWWVCGCMVGGVYVSVCMCKFVCMCCMCMKCVVCVVDNVCVCMC